MQEGENCTAWQRFLPDGPIAMLPVSCASASLLHLSRNVIVCPSLSYSDGNVCRPRCMLFLSRLENNDMTDGRTDARTLHCIIYPSLYLSIVTCGQRILMKVCIAERVDFFMIYNVARLQPP